MKNMGDTLEAHNAITEIRDLFNERMFNDDEHYSTVIINKDKPSYKYNEDKILDDLRGYLSSTYTEHYQSDDKSIECFDAWIALGDPVPTFRNTALKYIWRYGKKNGSNKKDLLKAMHYIMMCLHVDHYSKKGE